MGNGLYTLGSGILTQNRVLDTISNNIANVNTPGFKKSDVIASSFGQMVINRIDSETTPLGNLSMISTADETNTDYSQGLLKSTDRTLDFAIKGEGFFAVQTNNGLVYTRNGSFNLDSEGYLVLNNVGRVMGTNGEICLKTDDFTSDSSGNLYVAGKQVDKLAVYDFNDYSKLKTVGEGTYSANNPIGLPNTQVMWKTIEGSNVDTAEEMTNTMVAQRGLQSCSQALKMYDTILGKAATEIAKL